ncbi:MAG TPA: hypothetical protein VK798_15545 [Alloacidobacterium sp.]|jgi:hypothetical protein|nr:hypothetical protein [Alloacidobacterium sp.]
MVRAILERTLMGVLIALPALYAGDWLVYRYRLSHKTALDSVTVHQFITVPLKIGRNEYDYVGSQQVPCVRAIFPWAGDDPCWWLRRHTEVGISQTR